MIELLSLLHIISLNNNSNTVIHSKGKQLTENKSCNDLQGYSGDQEDVFV